MFRASSVAFSSELGQRIMVFLMLSLSSFMLILWLQEDDRSSIGLFFELASSLMRERGLTAEGRPTFLSSDLWLGSWS